MQKVILDANILIAPIKLGFNLDSEIMGLLGEFQGMVTQATLGEVERLNLPKDVIKASMALARRYSVVQTDAMGDDAILEAAEHHDAIVVTADRELVSRALAKGLKVIGIREGHRLVWYSSS